MATPIARMASSDEHHQDGEDGEREAVFLLPISGAEAQNRDQDRENAERQGSPQQRLRDNHAGTYGSAVAPPTRDVAAVGKSPCGDGDDASSDEEDENVEDVHQHLGKLASASFHHDWI